MPDCGWRECLGGLTDIQRGIHEDDQYQRPDLLKGGCLPYNA